MIRVTAYAKVNFYLEITGKRPDGYHLLDTLFQTISLGDRLTVKAADSLVLTCSDPSLPTGDDNLVMRAAVRLRDYLKESRGAAIHLEKRVPMGAGLGGGSSDAAAVLKALLRLWKRQVSLKALSQLAVSLGADVPFFLQGGLCRATGIGELLKPLKPLPRTWIVLVYPGFGVSTKEAYAKVKLPFGQTRRLPNGQLKDVGLWSVLFNRFEELVFPDHPPLPRVKEDLVKAGAIAALMSGSGSSVFGLVSSRSQGTRVLRAIRKRYPQSWLVHTL